MPNLSLRRTLGKDRRKHCRSAGMAFYVSYSKSEGLLALHASGSGGEVNAFRSLGQLATTANSHPTAAILIDLTDLTRGTSILQTKHFVNTMWQRLRGRRVAVVAKEDLVGSIARLLAERVD